MRIPYVMLCGLMVSGCALPPDLSAPDYISSDEYQNLSCDTIDREWQSTQRALSHFSNVQSNLVATHNGLALLSPLNPSTVIGDHSAQIRTLKGTMLSLAHASKRQRCASTVIPEYNFSQICAPEPPNLEKFKLLSFFKKLSYSAQNLSCAVALKNRGVVLD
jgi:hypothetical protein